MKHILLVALASALVLGCSSDKKPVSVHASAAKSSSALWQATMGSPTVARQSPAMVSLNNGRVVVYGGLVADGGATGATEIFDPSNGTWTSASPLNTPRAQMTGALDSNNDALALAGWNNGALLATAEAFSLDAGDGGAWVATPTTLNVPRAGVMVAELRGQGSVIASSFGAEPSVEFYNYVDAGLSLVAPLVPGRSSFAMRMLQDGGVMVAGGETDAGIALRTTALFTSPDSGWATGPSLAYERAGAAVSPLGGGRFILIGGRGSADASVSAEVYNPATDSWVSTGPLMNPRTTGHTATTLINGDVLVVGGPGLAGRKTERYVDGTNQFQFAGCLAQSRVNHAALSLPDASVLIVGGLGDAGLLATSEQWVEAGLLGAQGNSCSSDCECASGFCADGVCCNRACNGGPCEACSAAKGASSDGQCTLLSAATVCRPDAGLCDRAETCTGSSPLCPVDTFLDAGVVCRADAGVCDRPEVCTGLSVSCPADLKVDAGVLCRADAGICDRPEVCDGVSNACPANAFVDAGALCRPASGLCDRAESCTGSTTACPADTVLESGVTCRALAGNCDVIEVCDGTSTLCPPDTVLVAGVTCRTVDGGCDEAEQCTGSSGVCPADGFRASGTVCRLSAANCDLAEVCTGTGSACPTDVFVAQGVACGAYVCSGTAVSCPGSCTLSTQCSGTNTCQNSVCAPPVVDAGVPDAGPVDSGTVDAGEVDAGPVDAGSPDAGTFDSGEPDAGTMDAGDMDAGENDAGELDAGEVDAGEVDAGAVDSGARDAGNVDAGTTDKRRRYIGWACASSPSDQAALWALVVLAVIFSSRRRNSWAAGAAVAASLSAMPVRAQDSAVTTTQDVAPRPSAADFTVRAYAWGVRDFLASAMGAEVGASVGIGSRLDVGASVVLGPQVGARVHGTLHMADDEEWVRPWVQVRAALHPTSAGFAAGGGLAAGAHLWLARARASAGVLAEAMAGPPGFPVFGLYAVFGFELDLYRHFPEAAVGLPEDKEPPAMTAQLDRSVDPKAAGPVSDATAVASVNPAPPTTERAKVTARVNIREVILFDLKKSTFGDKGKASVQKIAGILSRFPQVKLVQVSGHADDGKNEAEHKKLSQARAKAVVDALLAAGVEEGRLVIKAYGDILPLQSSSVAFAKREQNRRVDFIILEQGEVAQ